jgi:hypothetical protein
MADTRQQAHIPFALQEAVVQACGTVFWYKDPLKAMLSRAGVPRPLIAAHSDAAKFLMVRQILAELDSRGEPGARVQHQIVRELAAMRTVQDPDNREAGLNALADLRAVAIEHGVIEDKGATPADDGANRRRAAAADNERVAEARRKGLGELHKQYTAMVTRPDEAQRRGYDLQDLLAGLFRLHDIPYHPPYRKGTVEETDGFFTFQSFDYLMEARWREKPPPIADLRAFSGKVTAKLQSTRGLFLSIAGFRAEVVDEAAPLSNLILMDGEELAVIMEGRISLIGALQLKLDKAAQQGNLYYSVARQT